MRFRSEAGRGDLVSYINFGLRTLQFLVGLALVIMYATQPAYKLWLLATSISFSLGIAAGALALATTPFLGVLPFFIGYKPVAFACVWDFVVMAVYAATFAYYKGRFPYGDRGDVFQKFYQDGGVSSGRVNVMRGAVTVDLVGMLLWLITFLMGVILLAMGKVRGGKRDQGW